MYLSPRTKVVATIALSVFVASCVVFSGLRYVILRETRSVHEQMTMRGTAAVRQQQVTLTSKALESTLDERTRLKGALVADAKVTEFLEFIEHAARREGLSVSTNAVAVEPLAGNSSFESLLLELEVNGSYERVTRFVALLETLPFQVTLSQVGIDRTEDVEGESWTGRISFAVTKEKSL